jgi:hypothetical protein
LLRVKVLSTAEVASAFSHDLETKSKNPLLSFVFRKQNLTAWWFIMK